MKKYLASIFLVWISSQSFARAETSATGFFKLNKVIQFTASQEKKRYGDYIDPNENSELGIAVYKSVAPGLVITVGFERAYMLAVLMNAATEFLVVDDDPHVIRLHEINFNLIRLSKGSRELYLKLRNSPNFEMWTGAMSSNDIALSEEEFHYWSERVGQNSKFDIFMGYRPGFSGAHSYVQNDESFERVYKLVKTNRFQAERMDLANPKHVDALVDGISNAKIPLAAVDLSNAHAPNYIDDLAFMSLISKLSKVSAPHTLLSLTAKKIPPASSGVFGSSASNRNQDLLNLWAFFGITFDLLKEAYWQGELLQSKLFNLELNSQTEQLDGQINPETLRDLLKKGLKMSADEYLLARRGNMQLWAPSEIRIASELSKKGLSMSVIEDLLLSALELTGPYHKEIRRGVYVVLATQESLSADFFVKLRVLYAQPKIQFDRDAREAIEKVFRIGQTRFSTETLGIKASDLRCLAVFGAP